MVVPRACSSRVAEVFIAMYRNEPCLWKIKEKEYHDRELKNLAYSELIDKLKVIDPNADNYAAVKKNQQHSFYLQKRT